MGAFMGKEGRLRFQGGGQRGATAKVTLEAPACAKALRQELWSGRGWVRVAGAKAGGEMEDRDEGPDVGRGKDRLCALTLTPKARGSTGGFGDQRDLVCGCRVENRWESGQCGCRGQLRGRADGGLPGGQRG